METTYADLFEALLKQKLALEKAGKDTSEWFPAANELLAVSYDIPGHEAQADGYRLMPGKRHLADGLDEKSADLRARALELTPLVAALEKSFIAE